MEFDPKNKPETARAHAYAYCSENPEWKPIDDLTVGVLEGLLLTWDELPEWEKSLWVRAYGEDAPEAWKHFASPKPMRVPYACMGWDGILYQDPLVMPLGANHCMIFKVGSNG